MAEVCYICGDRGFSNAFLGCSECSVIFVHQYCLGIPPGSIDDTFDWVCECCSLPMETEFSQKFGGTTQIIVLQEQPQPLCTLLPVQYNGSPTKEKISKLSKEQESSISSYMENPNSIMAGLVLLVSPSGEVFIEGATGTIELDERGEISGHLIKPVNAVGITRCTNSEVDGSEEKDLSSTSSESDGEVSNREIASSENEGDSNNSTGSSMEEPRRGKRKRTREAEIEVIHHKKAKAEADGEGLRDTRKLVRHRIVTMLLSAGWTIEYRERKDGTKDRVFVSPQGNACWSIPKAYSVLERDVKNAKARKTKYGDGNSNFVFKPLSKELLRVLRKT